MSTSAQPAEYRYTVSTPQVASEFLAQQTGVAKGRIKDAMVKGAVWLWRDNAAARRIRRATLDLKSGDRIAMFYDPALLQLQAVQPRCLVDRKRYSIWYKPPGLLTQGSWWGDHCSLARQAELALGGKREIFVVHRLDREADGLVLLAHDKNAAARLSALFQGRSVEKRYRVSVLGDVATAAGREGVIEAPLDGKAALSRYRVEEYDKEANVTRLQVQIETGRKHQIRRHLDVLGHPVMGDPRYGRGNKNEAGLQLTANYLAFTCPFSNQPVSFSLDALLRDAK